MKCHHCGGTGEEPNGPRRPEARAILDFLNEKTGHHYQPCPVILDKIVARLNEGATVLQAKAVISRKVYEWTPDEKMAKYLRPATLFGREKFANYLGELPATAFEHAGG